MSAIYLEPNQVPAILRGGYSGKKFKVEITNEVTIPSDAGLWSGGSRDTYSVIRLADGSTIAASDNISSPWNDTRRDRTIPLSDGMAVIRHSMFCGKDMGLTFYVHPDNAAKLLPPPSDELTANEQLVINGTCQYKSSYNGQDRYQMTCEHYSREPLMTRAQWDEAKVSLIAKGLLNKAGAITPAGRNARK